MQSNSVFSNSSGVGKKFELTEIRVNRGLIKKGPVFFL